MIIAYNLLNQLAMIMQRPYTRASRALEELVSYTLPKSGTIDAPLG